MTSLIITSRVKGCIFVCGGIISLSEESNITIPLSSEKTVIFFFPFCAEYLPATFEIGKIPRLNNGESSLYKWNKDLYQLEICPQKIFIPQAPIITHQLMWGKGYCGLCGGFFCTEFDGKMKSFDGFVEKFEILSENYALLKCESTIIAVNRDCEQKLKIEDVSTYSVNKNVLSVVFSPGRMEFFTVVQEYETTTMRLISNKITKSEIKDEFDKISCFCQATRLNIKDEADKMTTDQLKAETDFDSIRSFLGNFDKTEKPITPSFGENAIALRYKTDNWNYEYVIFSFSLKNGLIDDIEQC